jgi:TatD DNase family protein
LVPGIDLDSSRAALQLADHYPEIFAAVGIHPNEAISWNQHTISHLKELASHPKVVAIGEIGLDYYRDRAPRDLQRRILSAQLTLASSIGLPVVIHNRNATIDLLEILEEWRTDLVVSGSELAEHPGVFHSFSDLETTANKAIEIEFYIGFTGPLTFRNATVSQHVAASLPLDRILVETDSPFLTPVPYRGKRNEPAYVRFVVEKIAELHEESFDTIALKTTENAATLFRW